MTTIKMYTDIPQSKVLVGILPLETADMYRVFENNAETRVYFGKTPTAYFVCEPCWSLAKLLDILKDKIIFGGASDKGWFVSYTIKNPRELLIIYESNLVDACVNMVEKLHKLNLL